MDFGLDLERLLNPQLLNPAEVPGQVLGWLQGLLFEDEENEESDLSADDEEEKNRVVALGHQILLNDAVKAVEEGKTYCEWIRYFSPWDVGPPIDAGPLGILSKRANTLKTGLARAWMEARGSFTAEETKQMEEAVDNNNFEIKGARDQDGASIKNALNQDSVRQMIRLFLGDPAIVKALQSQTAWALSRIAAGASVGNVARAVVTRCPEIQKHPFGSLFVPTVTFMAKQMEAWMAVVCDAQAVIIEDKPVESAELADDRKHDGTNETKTGFTTDESVTPKTAEDLEEEEEDNKESARIRKELSVWMQKDLENKMIQFKRMKKEATFKDFSLEFFRENCVVNPDGSVELSGRLSEVEALWLVVQGSDPLHKLGNLPALGPAKPLARR